MKLLEEKKDRIVVAPAINWLWATLYDAEPFGYTFDAAEAMGYKRETEIAVAALREMHRRGIIFLPGGWVAILHCYFFRRLSSSRLYANVVNVATIASPGAHMVHMHETSCISISC
jgi:hypothetical protein